MPRLKQVPRLGQILAGISAPDGWILAVGQILAGISAQGGDIFCNFADSVAGAPLFWMNVQFWM